MSYIFLKACLCGMTITGSILFYVLYNKIKNKKNTNTNNILTLSRLTKIKIKVPKNCKSLFFSQHKNNIKEIEESTETKIFFHRTNNEESYDLCTIQGKRENLKLAESIIHNIITSQPVIESFNIYISENDVKKLIGFRGANVINIQKTARSKIEVDPNSITNDEEKRRKVTITGSKEQIEHSISLIEKTIQNNECVENTFNDYK